MAVTLDRIPAEMEGGGHVDLGDEQIVTGLKNTEVTEIASWMRVVPVLRAPVRVDLAQSTTAGPRVVAVPGHRVAPGFTPYDRI